MSLNRLDPQADLNDPRVRAQLNETLDLLASMILRGGRDGAQGLKGDKGDPGDPGAAGGADTAEVSAQGTWWHVKATGGAEFMDIDSEIFDYGDLFDPGTPSRFTVSEAGRYVFSANTTFAVNGTGIRQTILYHYNSAGVEQINERVILNNNGAGAGVHVHVFMVRECAEGDYFRFQVAQDSGGDLGAGGSVQLFKIK